MSHQTDLALLFAILLLGLGGEHTFVFDALSI